MKEFETNTHEVNIPAISVPALENKKIPSEILHAAAIASKIFNNTITVFINNASPGKPMT
ncbi:hypothetical protein R0K05_06525 [Planococcus sp. SIMBA_160]